MKKLDLFIALLLLIAPSRGGEPFDETRSTTIFAFDDVSIPYTQNLRLEMLQPIRHSANPVVPRGAPGSPDAYGVQFYGSVIRDNGRYRMWYVAFDDEITNKTTSSRWRAAYAESVDGVTWTKPNLGLVKFRGNRNNNLVYVGDEPWGFVNLKVIKDESDPDPERRYKMTTHVYFQHNTRLGTLLPFVSADGLTWKPVKALRPVKAQLKKEDLFIPGVHFEPCGGLYQWDGQFIISGQNALPGTHQYQGRVVRLYRSRDFVNWAPTNRIAFVRTPQHTYLGPGRSREGEQTHEGISVWNRGNILLGISGLWHGGVEWKDVTIDLGFVISDDGLTFREPKHEWTFLKRGEDGEWDQGGLLQGQGFENIGDQTLIYYGAWDPRHRSKTPERGGVGIAVLPRDRFADLVVDQSGKGSGDYQLPVITSEFVTTSFPVEGIPRFHLNADGLGEDAAIKIELLDHYEKPLPGYIATIRTSGFHTPIVWDAPSGNLPERIRLHATFEGKRNTDIRFSAIYMQK